MSHRRPRVGEALWLEPYPDVLLAGLADRPGLPGRAITRFDPGVPRFGLPRTLPD